MINALAACNPGLFISCTVSQPLTGDSWIFEDCAQHLPHNEGCFHSEWLLAHFNIPKLGGLHAYLTHIPQMGSSPQYSSEVTETLHQTMAKAAYKVTNCRTYQEQICQS